MVEVRQDTKPAALRVPAPQFGANDPAPEKTWRVTLAAAGQAQDPQRPGPPQRASLRVSDPQFPTKIPAGRRSSTPVPPAPGGQPDPNPQTGNSSVGPPRWARCPEQGRLHLLQPADVIAATNQGHARAVCRRPILAEGLTITSRSSGALCMVCVLGATSPISARGPRGGNP